MKAHETYPAVGNTAVAVVRRCRRSSPLQTLLVRRKAIEKAVGVVVDGVGVRVQNSGPDRATNIFVGVPHLAGRVSVVYVIGTASQRHCSASSLSALQSSCAHRPTCRGSAGSCCATILSPGMRIAVSYSKLCAGTKVFHGIGMLRPHPVQYDQATRLTRHPSPTC
jgi:hypothetical protein